MNQIKESFDNLPIAVCYFNVKGMPRLMNRRMFALGLSLRKGGIQTLDELHQALQAPDAGVTRLDAALPIYRFPDGAVMRFRESIVTTTETYTEVTATDVTELMATQQALREENARLAQANRRARRLFEQIPQLVREEETLEMKMRIHDDIGCTLLCARKALRERLSLDVLRQDAAQWERSIDLLCRAEETQDDPLQYAEQRAAALGAALVLTGALPESEETRYLYALALRECAANCVRHAGGSRVFAHAEAVQGIWHFRITNDGAPPQTEVREGGGLSALRRRLIRAGGNMKIDSAPRFCLRVTLPDREETA